MALNGNRLGDAIKAQIDTLKGSINPANPDAGLQAIWRAIGTEIVNEIKNNGVVSTTVAVETSINVPSVPHTSIRPGTGTGTGTIA